MEARLQAIHNTDGELDLEVVYRTCRRQQIALTAARYHAAARSTDTTKVMVWSTFGF